MNINKGSKWLSSVTSNNLIRDMLIGVFPTKNSISI